MKSHGLSNLISSFKDSYSFIGKSFLLICILFSLGLPIQGEIEFFFLLFIVLGLITGDLKINGLKSYYILGTVALIVTLKFSLPRANIEEGHNAFLTKGSADEFLLRSLPTEVYQFMSGQFRIQYPKEKSCKTENPGCWRRGELPKETFASSSDSFYRSYKYSRLVDSINFDSLENFRGGFINSLNYNWWDGDSDVKRVNMPYFVMYELPYSLIGSNLCWKGHVLWEKSIKDFEHLYYPFIKCKPIKPEDIGKKIFGASILKNEPLSMTLKLSTKLKISSILKKFTSIIGALIILILGIRLNIRSFTIPAAIITLTLIAIPPETVRSFVAYPIMEGFDDGLLHESYGRDIFKNIIHGEIKEALRGNEDVFYFMPGIRYFFAFEKFFFGDSGLGKLCFLLLMPLSYYFFLRIFFSGLFSSFLLILFLFVTSCHHLHNAITLRAYTDIALQGEGEVLGYSLFLFGVGIILKYFHKSPEKIFLVAGIFGNCLIAFSIIVRPNLVLPTCLFFLYLSWELYRFNRAGEFFITQIGFLPFFLMPLHNYYFGQSWVLLTSPSSVSATLSFGVSPLEYFETLKALILNDMDGGHFEKVKTHLNKWVENRWWRGYLFAFSMLPLLPFKWISFQLRSLALLCLGSHLMLFCFYPGGRYAFIAWLISIIIGLVIVTDGFGNLKKYFKNLGTKAVLKK